jgi:GMP synthase-like glutamine amidotransferase
LGSIANWLNARGASVSWTRFHDASAVLPSPADVDFLIVLGGPMSVNDEAVLPWLVEEKRFIGEFVRADKPVLGICLGAQLMANALGARVYPGPQKEIGWFPIEGLPVPEGCFAFPEIAEVFHWHGETFDLPAGAVRLARSAVCANQAFQYGPRAIALQFHLETTPESANEITTHCGNELIDAPYVQDEATLRSASAESYAAINRMMASVLDYLVR